MSLFPMFLKLTARPCVVIGAGTIAEGKIEALLQAEAQVTVIAPEALPRVQAWAEGGDIVWHPRVYQAGDLAGAFLAIAGTNTPAVNRAVFAEATAASILCNAVDDPPFCDFFFPSIVRRGELQIAISTAGESPALAQRLRREINAQLPPDTGDWLQELGRLRREVTAVEPIGEPRKLLLHELAQREVCGFDGCPSRARARAHFREEGYGPPLEAEPTLTADKAGGEDGAPDADKAGGEDGAPGADKAGGEDGAPGADKAGGEDGAPGVDKAGGEDGAPGVDKAGGEDGAPRVGDGGQCGALELESPEESVL